MNEITVFQNEKFGEVRTVELNGEPWFVGKDIAEALGYSNSKDALIKHVEEEDKQILKGSDLRPLENHIPKSIFPVDFVQGDIPNRGLTVINESGLYSLIFGSKLDSAKEFKHWVTSEVLPSIRKTGGYVAPVASGKSDAEIRNEEKALKIESAKFLHELAASYSLPEYRQILDAYAVKEVVGEFALPLPEMKKNGMNAGDVGARLGISGQMVGKLANKYGLKTEEFGTWRMDKAKFSSKEVPNFFYFDNAIDKFRECLELEAQEKAKVKEAS
jgi:prophage antirepressor-like protein